MPDAADMELLKLQADFCKTFADPKRLFIIKELCHGERSVGQLAKRLGVRPTNVSQHLTILRDKGAVEARREATTVYYRLSDPKIGQACQLMQEVLLNQLEKTRELVERLGL